MSTVLLTGVQGSVSLSVRTNNLRKQKFMTQRGNHGREF